MIAKKTKGTKLTVNGLIKKGFPYGVALGIVAVCYFGLNPKTIDGIKNYHELKQLFPTNGIVYTIEDGDTFTLKNGVIVRLIGVNAPERGSKNYTEATNYLTENIKDKRVYLEYDRYQDDVYSRVLAWVWIDCESTPKFMPSDYMHKSGNESNLGLTENPKGCKKGKLVNEELVKQKLASPVVYKDRGELKYEVRLKSLKSP